MNSKTKPTKPLAQILPLNVAAALNVDFGGQTNVEIAGKFGLSVGQLARMTGLIGEIYNKKIPVGQIDFELASRLGLAKDKVAKLALEICGKRLMIVNTVWFDGAVGKKIKELGGVADDYNEFIAEYVENVISEKAEETATQRIEQEEEKITLKKAIKKKIEEDPIMLKDPLAEKQSLKKVFGTNVVHVLSSGDYRLKIELNIRLITLLLNDEPEQVFHKELLTALYNNHEVLTSKRILLKDEKVEPTISNWLKDYVGSVGQDETGSAIQKAQYFTSSPNIRALLKEEKELVDGLFKFYIALQNFYSNVRKMDMEDIYIFPFTPKEQESLLKEISELESEEEEEIASVEGEKAEVGTINIMELYQDKPDDRQKIDEEKQKIVQNTRKEYDKIADAMEPFLLNRKKHSILACLELLVETGALDNMLGQDERYQGFLSGYFKRNNLQAEDEKFKKDPYQAKYVQAFLRFVFLERLGLAPEEGARIAANYSNIFRNKGAIRYSQLAYLDLSDNKFKWSEL